MSETTLTAIVVAALASLPPTLVALKGLFETRLNRAVSGLAAEQNVEQNDALIEKSDQIHALVNSNMTAVKADLEAANRQIVKLQELVTDLVAERDERAKR